MKRKSDINKEKADLLWETLDMNYNSAAGYVSYKNLNHQFGSKETEFDATAGGISKLKEIPSWKKSYSGFTSVKKRGFCISTVTNSIVRGKIDELHSIISSKKFFLRDEATPAFNSILFDDSEELRKYNRPPYSKELKIDGGRNMLLVTKLQDNDPMEKRGKQLSEEIGEHIRVEVLKNLKVSTRKKAGDGMVLTWLETQGPVDGDKVVYNVLGFLKFIFSGNTY